MAIGQFAIMDLFRNTLGPVAWTIIALVPPAIFVLYFLRLKRQPLEVPSTYLWTKVIEDLHVNSLWQKLRRNLLLFLQLLLVGLAILALLRPGWEGESLEGQKFIFLVDRSASMSTADATSDGAPAEAGRGVPAPGETRLADAKRRVAALVDQMESGMAAMIIAFDEQPDVVQEFTDNRRLLREALDRIQPTNKPTNIRGALELASGFANPERVAIEEGGTEFPTEAPEPVELYIFSDGRFGAVEGFSLGNLQPKYLPIGGAQTNNLAVTALNTRRNELRPEQRQAFVQVANFSDAEQTADVSLYLDGKLFDAAQIKIAAGDVAGATFNMGDVAAGKLEARLEPPTELGDRLALDDRGYAALDKQQQSRVLLVTPGNNAALELGLSTERVRRFGTVAKVEPKLIGTPDFQREMQAEIYDLVIFDQCAPDKPEQMPLANTLFIGRLPPLPAWQAGSSSSPAASSGDPAPTAPANDALPARVEAPQIIDWQRSHPLLNLVELGNVAVIESLIVKPPSGGKVLVDSTKGALMAIAPRDSFEDAVIGFEIVGADKDGATLPNTNWPRRHSFPNFCLNVVQYLGGGAADLQIGANRPGETVELDLAQRAERVTVVLPDKSTRVVATPTVGKLAFHETDQLGVYDVMAGEQLAARFAVNLFDRQESDVRLRARQDEAGGVQTVESVSIGYVDVAAESPSTPMRKELWTWLLLAALFVLVLEWYIYNRRVYV
jgi:hypothetical protein